MKLLLSFENTNLSQRLVAVRELMSFLESIGSSPATAEVFFYLLENGAVTAWVLQVDLMIPEATAYRTLKRLRKMNIVFDAVKIRKQKGDRGGPRVIVWALQGTPPEVVAKAVIKHRRALSPKYRVAELFVQDILEPHLARNPHGRGITYKRIIQYARGHTAPFRNIEIAELAATILTMKGIEVWR